MAEVEHSSMDPVLLDPVEPSFRRAIPYFLPVAAILLIINAAVQGGWWIAAPLVFFFVVDPLDTLFGMEERNMNPDETSEGQLLWHRLALDTCVALWPPALAFVLWWMLDAGGLAIWEVLLMAVVLGNMSTVILVAGHELIHDRAAWRRRYGEFLLSSVGCGHYATEHVYVHHPRVATPADPMTARKGQSFWRYLPWAVAGSIRESWRHVRERLAQRRRLVWHYSNPFWRYALGVAFWYALAFWMGGPLGLLVFTAVCGMAVFSLRLGDYVEHYGLSRRYLSNGRFERVQRQHSWSAAGRISNWLYYNTQRHADHHCKPVRLFPLLQNHRTDIAPRMPGCYGRMFGLALNPRRWFETMDPMVDEWRRRFYPDIDDWRVYDSPAFAARPDMFKEIAEVTAGAPRMAVWIDDAPDLLDGLREREFSDLDLPDGFGPDPEYEAIARRGLARLYWTRELGVPEMREQIDDIPAQGVRETVETVRSYANRKVFQIGVLAMRGSLSPAEAATATANVAQAAIGAVLSAVFEDAQAQAREGTVLALCLGDLTDPEAAARAAANVAFVCDGGSEHRARALCGRFEQALQVLSRDSVLFDAQASATALAARPALSLAEFADNCRRASTSLHALDLVPARTVFVAGELDAPAWLEGVRREVLVRYLAGEKLAARLHEIRGVGAKDAPAPASDVLDRMRGGVREVTLAARCLQLQLAEREPQALDWHVDTVFEAARSQELIHGEAAAGLTRAWRLWRDVRGILRFVGEGVETAPPETRAVVARACGVADFDALTAEIAQTARCAALGVDQLAGH